jgi:hypothetical protein
MQRHQVDRKRVHPISVLYLRSKHKVVELSELVHELPDPIIGRVEDVRTVLVNVDSITTLAVAVSADVRSLIYQENLLALATSLMGKNATE